MTEALILSCSAAKRQIETLPCHLKIFARPPVLVAAPAVLVYDGPHWRILRKHNPKVQVFALSGFYGLYSAIIPISHYDTLMPYQPTQRWLADNVLTGSRQKLGHCQTVWYCVPNNGGYAVAVEALKQHLSNVKFRPIYDADTLSISLPPLFARTQALSRFCRERGRGRGRILTDFSAEEWENLVQSGRILGG